MNEELSLYPQCYWRNTVNDRLVNFNTWVVNADILSYTLRCFNTWVTLGNMFNTVSRDDTDDEYS